MSELKYSQPSLHRGLPERRYLPELHGVRGLALLGVVLFHVFGNGRVSGGIDIFLAVSGFLFTGMLLREAATSNGRIDPLKYYGRLIRRILVPAAIVVIATLAAGLVISPVTQHSQLWAEARASLLYFENFELIHSQLAYGAAGPETSPFQHFWSLSVQGQFYIIWPVLAILAVFLGKRFRTSAARVMAVLITVVLIASGAYAIYVGSFNQDEAYLMTTTRAWQLAFGGLLALAAGTIRLPRALRWPAGWVGLALIVSCGFVLDGGALFPGPWALWPLAGLTLVLIAAGPNGGDQDPKGSATYFLSNKVLSWIGDHAYGLYLWHWPLLIFYLEIRNRQAVGLRGALVVLAITVVFAILTYRFVEVPLKNRQNTRSPRTARTANTYVAAIAAGALVVAGSGATWVVQQPQHQVANVFEDWDWEAYPGAMSTTGQYEPTPISQNFLPQIEHLPAEPDYYSWDCRQPGTNNPGTDEILVCEDPATSADSQATVVLAGGSHAGQWHHAFRELAKAYNWRLLIADRSGCFFQDIRDAATDMCASWQINFMDWLSAQDVELVVTPGTRMSPVDGPEYVHPQAPERWDEILETGTELLLIRGIPRHEDNIADCLASTQDLESCGPDIKQVEPENPLDFITLSEGITAVDFTEHICPAVIDGQQQLCDPIVGNVSVWRDYSHLSNQYVETMTPIIEAELRGQIPWLFTK